MAPLMLSPYHVFTLDEAARVLPGRDVLQNDIVKARDHMAAEWGHSCSGSGRCERGDRGDRAPREHRDLEAELPDRGAHAIDHRIVLPGVPGVVKQTDRSARSQSASKF